MKEITLFYYSGRIVILKSKYAVQIAHSMFINDIDIWVVCIKNKNGNNFIFK